MSLLCTALYVHLCRSLLRKTKNSVKLLVSVKIFWSIRLILIEDEEATNFKAYMFNQAAQKIYRFSTVSRWTLVQHFPQIVHATVEETVVSVSLFVSTLLSFSYWQHV